MREIVCFVSDLHVSAKAAGEAVAAASALGDSCALLPLLDGGAGLEESGRRGRGCEQAYRTPREECGETLFLSIHPILCSDMLNSVV